MNEDPKAVEHIREERKVLSAYRDAWVRIVRDSPQFERDGHRVLLGEDSVLDKYKAGIGTKLNQKIKLTCPTNEFVLDYIEANAGLGLGVVAPRSGKGGTVFICGNGRGLSKHVDVIRRHGMHEKAHVWGCNGAANWLHANGPKLTHAFTTDTSRRMWQECWKNPPKAHYLIASCVDTRTIDHVMSAGNLVTLFHNFTGIPGEIERYQSLYPTAPLVGEGLNSVNRAMALADVMGFEKIYILGAVEHLDPMNKRHHADGAASNQQYILVAEIDGRMYATHADLLYSAVDLVRRERQQNGTLCKADWRKLPEAKRREYDYQHDGTYLPKGRKKRVYLVGGRRDLGMILRTKDEEFLNRCIQFGAEEATPEAEEATP